MPLCDTVKSLCKDIHGDICYGIIRWLAYPAPANLFEFCLSYAETGWACAANLVLGFYLLRPLGRVTALNCVGNRWHIFWTCHAVEDIEILGGEPMSCAMCTLSVRCLAPTSHEGIRLSGSESCWKVMNDTVTQPITRSIRWWLI